MYTNGGTTYSATLPAEPMQPTGAYGVAATPSSPPSPPASPPPPPPASPPPPPAASPPPPSPPVFVQGDPHLHLAHGGRADFRGRDGAMYALLSAPGVQFAALTQDTDFLLPVPPRFVAGSCFTKVSWTLRGLSGSHYGVESAADSVGFRVYNLSSRGGPIVQYRSIWKNWVYDGLRVSYKQSTIYVRAAGWEVNATRHPIYLHVRGASRWRFDMAMRKLDQTPFAAAHGESSATCFPHGLIGQSWDSSGVGVRGAVDEYDVDPAHPVVVTKAMAEGAIEGVASEYEVAGAFDTAFAYSRFERHRSDTCAPRNATGLTGARVYGAPPGVAYVTDVA